MDRRPIISFRLAAVAVISFGIGCDKPVESPEPPPPPVRVTTVSIEAQRRVVRVTAPIDAERRATLRTETGGRVVEAPFRAGATVSRGDVVVRLGGPRTAISVSESQARVTQASASLRQMTRARHDAEALARQNANTPNVVETARDRETEAEARLREAEAGLAAARTGVSETSLRAPFDGVLADFRVNVGEFVTAGTEVAVLVNRDALEAELLLDPREGADARLDDPVTVTVSEHADIVFVGRVDFVGDVLDPRTRRLPVRVAIDDPDGVLRPGSVGAFELSVGEPRDVVRLPDGAVLRRMGRTQVLVVTDDIAEARDVEIGEIVGGHAEVVGGLSAGDSVVVDGVERVVPGQPVRVVSDLAAQRRQGATDEGAEANEGP